NFNTKFWISFLGTVIIGFLIAKLDTSKNWNDTGVTAGLILIAAFIPGFLVPRFAWLCAIIIGGLIFSFNVALAGNYGSAVAILLAFTGAYLGVLCKKYIFASINK